MISAKISKAESFDINFKDKGYEPDAVLNYVTSVGSGFTDSTAGKTLQELIGLVCIAVHNTSTNYISANTVKPV